MTDCLNLG